MRHLNAIFQGDWRFIRQSMICLTILSLISSTAFAETLTPDSEPVTLMSLSDALNMADQYNFQLQANKKNIDLGQTDIRIAGEIPNPQFQIQMVYGNIYRVAASPNQQNINHVIETAGKRRKRVDAAKAALQVTQYQFETQRWDIRYQTKQAYSDYDAAIANLAAIEAQASLLKTMVDIARKRFKAGAVPESEVLQAKLALSQLKTQRRQAVGQVEQAKYHLNTLLGNPPQAYQLSDLGVFSLQSTKSDVAPLPSKPLPDLATLLQKAQNSRLDLKALVSQVTVNEKQLRLVQAQKIPDLQFAGGYLYNHAPYPYSPVNYKAYFHGPMFQIGANLPLYHNQQAETKKAQIAVVQAKVQVDALRKQIQEDVITAYQGIVAAQENIKLYEDNLLPHSTEVVHLAQESYQYGKSPLSNVILVQQADQQVRQGYIQALTNYQTSWNSLEHAVGSPLM